MQAKNAIVANRTNMATDLCRVAGKVMRVGLSMTRVGLSMIMGRMKSGVCSFLPGAAAGFALYGGGGPRLEPAAGSDVEYEGGGETSRFRCLFDLAMMAVYGSLICRRDTALGCLPMHGGRCGRTS